MIKNKLKLIIRSAAAHKAHTTINIAGLAISIAACLLLFAVVHYELSYNTFEKNYKDIYRVVRQDKDADGIDIGSGNPFPARDALRNDFPQITTGTLFASFGSQVTVPDTHEPGNAPEKFIEETGFFFCDPQFFRVFNHHWLAGSADVLNEPYTTVLTRKMADRYFGDWRNAVGKLLNLNYGLLRVNYTATVKVAGILEDVPDNSDFPLKIVTSFETLNANAGPRGFPNRWGAVTSNFQLFLLLPEKISPSAMNAQLAEFSRKRYPDNHDLSTLNFLQPLSELHFDNRYDNFGDHITSRSTIWTLSLIGIFIIVMACINFINLSTALAVRRSREIGIRKVLGGNRLQIFAQVMGETAFIVAIAIVLAACIAWLCLPFIKYISPVQEALNLFNQETAAFLGGIMVLVTLFSGLYPALVISGFRPVLALKNKITSATLGGISLRRGLVVTQFTISQVLIAGTIVAISQMNYVHNANLGFNKEAVFLLNANTDSTLQLKSAAFKQKLLQTPGVLSVSCSSEAPSSDNASSTNFSFDHRPEENFNLYLKYADEDYFATYGLQLVAGRVYDKSDTAKEVIVNETLVKKLGIKHPSDILGKEIRMGGASWKTIVGVVKDFTARSLKEEIRPMIIAQRKDRYAVFGIKLSSSDMSKTQASIESIWNNHFPAYAFTGSYLTDNIARFYSQEDQLSLLYKIFAGIAIFISCLGLFGLVSFMTVQKKKETGIRKILGASLKDIVLLFSKEFTLLIALGFLIAIPVSYYMMNNWLQDFAFRIRINAGMFFIVILLSLIVAWITVGYISIKAALANPVKSLRTE
ncbi:ABC transporter permease [Niastella populi]|uniref:ABC transporter permease n=1 Tax=Niastella populi TaxID=550983 RepID=A0A1V9ENS3_9BACT|nr:ABC transporter permease [Niastella populi]OQP47731.1 ABC transporter permease [Niastella populi]